MSLRRFQAVLRGPGKDQQRQLQCASLGVGEGPAMVAGTGPSFRLSVSHALWPGDLLGVLCYRRASSFCWPGLHVTRPSASWTACSGGAYTTRCKQLQAQVTQTWQIQFETLGQCAAGVFQLRGFSL